MTGNPRQIAVRCLCDVEEGAYSNLAFKKRTAHADGDSRAVRFCARLFYGTLERMVTLDHILARGLTRGMDKLDTEVRAILRSGLYQMLFMDTVPAAAAVNESVKLCTVFKKSSASGLVNAVLRRAGSFDLAQICGIKDTITRLSLQYAADPALARLFLSQYGGEAEPLLAATLEHTPPAVRVNSLRTTPAQLARRLEEEGIRSEQAPVPGGLLILSGRYVRSGALADGSMRVQSVAAQYAVRQLDPRPSQKMLDLCAAPGGKTLTAAQQMADSGSITALDIHENRLTLLREQAALEGVTIVETVCADAAAFDSSERYDRVLCDVPCSGYGEMAQKPELRRKPPQTDGELPALQRRILDNGARLLKKGGRLVYATCTLDKRENEEVADSFLAQNRDFIPVPAKNLPPSAVCVGQYVKFMPQKDYSEGFFLVTLERI